MHGIALSTFSTPELARHCATRAAGWLTVIGSLYAAGAVTAHL